MPSHINLVYFDAAAPGTGTITQGAVNSGPYRLPASGDNGNTYVIRIDDGTNWEICLSVYTHSGTTWSRGTLRDSSTGSRVNFAAAVDILVVDDATEFDSFLVSGGALGTPSSGTLTSCTGLPISTGVSGLGTGVATLLSGNSSGTGGPVGTTSPVLVTPTLGAATGTSLTLTSTTTQQTWAYDGSNNVTLTVSSAGLGTFNATGSSAGFRFDDSISVNVAPATQSMVNIKNTQTNKDWIRLLATDNGLACEIFEEADNSCGFYIKNGSEVTTILLAGSDGSISCGSITLADAKNLIFNTTTGTKIGTATGQKLAFWGLTPVVQQVLATGAGATADNIISLLQTLGLCKQS